MEDTRTSPCAAASPYHIHHDMKVAFIGLGAIGRPMAAHLASRFDLHVWNRTGAVAESFAAEHQCSVAASPAAAARGAVAVITCLPTSHEVEQLLDADDGLFNGIDRGGLVIDCTSGDPTTSQRIAKRLATRSIDFVDAPVSGGTSGAEAGTLTVMCGGEQAAFDRALPFLQAFGKKIVLVGPTGAGDALKAVNNALLAVHIWSVAEGLIGLKKAGVSPSAALDVINASSGRSNASENLVPSRVVTRAFPRTFRLALLEKDIGIAAEFLHDQRVASPVIQQVAELFRLARTELGEEADHVEAVRLIERWSGTEIAD